jgi:hypothetical protein
MWLVSNGERDKARLHSAYIGVHQPLSYTVLAAQGHILGIRAMDHYSWGGSAGEWHCRSAVGCIVVAGVATEFHFQAFHGGQQPI